MPRFLVVLLWLVAGHAALAGLAWVFVNIPESNTLMVVLSVILGFLILVAASWIETVAVLAWDPSITGRDRWWRGMSPLIAFVPAGLLFYAVWASCDAGGQWLASHRGEIDAWLIARLGLVETEWVHRAAHALLFFVRWIVGTCIAATVLAFGARRGIAGVAHPRWIGAALSPRAVGASGLAFVLLIAIPLRLVYWRPPNLPPTWMEAAFVAAKLALLFVALNAGWALILWAAADAEQKGSRVSS
jgi:hypothetical protein